jgi:hypothetical protein
MNLGKRGMTGTLDVLTQAIASHTKGGQVLIDTLKSSKNAAADANIMFKQLPTSIQGLAKGLMDGSVNAAQFNKGIAGLDAPQQHMARQFEQLVKSSGSFNDLLKSGKPAAETYNAAMASMLGGTTGMKTALMLTGSNMAAFQASTDKVGTALASKSQDVENWSAIQDTFNQKMSEAKASVETTGIAIGTALLPAVTQIADAIMKVVKPVAQWVEGHQHLAGVVLASVAGFATFVGVVNLGAKAFGAVGSALSTVGKVFSGAWKGIQLVGTGLGKLPGLASSALGGIQSAGSALADAAGSAASWVGNAASVAAGWVKAGAQAVIAAGRFLAVKTAQLAVAAATKAWTAAQWLFNAAMDANPITLIIIALIALAAGFAYLWTHSAAFRDFWIDTWHVIEDAAKAVWHFLQQAFSDIAAWIKDAWHGVQAVTQTVWRWFTDFVMMQVNAAKAVIGWFGKLGSLFAGWLRDAVGAVSTGVGNVIIWFSSLPTKILGLLKDAGSWLFGIGQSILNGLLNGLKSAWNDVSGWVSQVGGWISNLKGPIEVDAVLLTPHGSAIMQGLLEGIRSQMPALEAQLGHVTATVRTSVAPAIPATSTVGAHGAGGAIEVHNHFEGAHVMNERDMDQLADKMGRALATRILPQGGLRVAM